MSNQELISLVTLLFPIVCSLAASLYKRLLESLPSNKRTLVQDAVDSSVRAVEQMYNGMSEASPADKKAKAVEIVSSALKDLHINIPSAVVDALIEESVFYLNQQTDKTSTQVGFTPPQKQ